MAITREALDAAEATGPEEPLVAFAYDRAPPEVELNPNLRSYAEPHAFVCSGGDTYWLKGRAQNGLSVELIAGRLAHRVDAGPITRIVYLPTEALPSNGVADHLAGLVVGFLAEPNMHNTKHLAFFITQGILFPVGSIDPLDYVLAMALRAWIGCGDPQALLSATSGRLRSVDYGDAFNPAVMAAPMALQSIPIPGVATDLGKTTHVVDQVIARFLSVTDEALLLAVSQVPAGPAWGLTLDERYLIAQALAKRRDAMKEVLYQWLI